MCNSYFFLVEKIFLIGGDFQKMAIQSVLIFIFTFFCPRYFVHLNLIICLACLCALDILELSVDKRIKDLLGLFSP